MCIECNGTGYREVHFPSTVFRNYCDCEAGEELQVAVNTGFDTKENFDCLDGVDGTVIDIRLTAAKRCVAVLIVTLIVIIIIAVFL